MSWSQAIVTYTITWWLMLFCVLPLGIERETDATPGSDPGAPKHARMARKLWLNTGLSTLVFLAIWGLIQSDLISFRRMD